MNNKKYNSKKDSKIFDSSVKENKNSLIVPNDTNNHSNIEKRNNNDENYIISSDKIIETDKFKYLNKLSSPFGGENIVEKNFDEEKFRTSLKEVLAKEDHKYIDTIVQDKKFFNNILAQEKAIVRGDDLDIIEILHKGDKKSVNLPVHIKNMGIKGRIKYLAHNHTNGLAIPSNDDIRHITLFKSKINPIYSPNKNSIIINNVSKNRKNVLNDYSKKLHAINKRIENKYPNKTKALKKRYSGDALKERLENDLYKPHYIKNQKTIASGINKMFKKNNYEIQIKSL